MILSCNQGAGVAEVIRDFRHAIRNLTPAFHSVIIDGAGIGGSHGNVSGIRKVGSERARESEAPDAVFVQYAGSPETDGDFFGVMKSAHQAWRLTVLILSPAVSRVAAEQTLMVVIRRDADDG